MSAAYLVKYVGPRGQQCPDAVVTFRSDQGENIAELAPLIERRLLEPRGGEWDRITITAISYLGPWFYGD